MRSCAAFVRIPFRPVPVKARRDGWTAERQRGFIDRLCLTGCVALSARAMGKTPQSIYRLRGHAGAGSFCRAWDKALASGQCHMIDVGIARGLVGEPVPVVRNGHVVGERLRTDSRLAMTALKALDRRAARSRARSARHIGALSRLAGSARNPSR